MSVIVKGMEMPNKCCECNIRYEMFCPLLHRFIADEGRRHNCPLGDVPTPHSKLIDADEFKKVLSSFNRMNVEKEGYGNTALGGIKLALYKLKHAPTIVEAEEQT